MFAREDQMSLRSTNVFHFWAARTSRHYITAQNSLKLRFFHHLLRLMLFQTQMNFIQVDIMNRIKQFMTPSQTFLTWIKVFAVKDPTQGILIGYPDYNHLCVFVYVCIHSDWTFNPWIGNSVWSDRCSNVHMNERMDDMWAHVSFILSSSVLPPSHP